MRSRTLVTAGAVGAGVAAVCCATPLLALLLGAVGLAARMANVEYVVIAAFVLCVGLMGLGLFRGRRRAR